MTDLISKAKLLNDIAAHCHYNTEDPLGSYTNLLNAINDAPTVNAAPVPTKRDVLNAYGVTYIADIDLDSPADAEFVDLVKNLMNDEEMFID